MLTNLVLIPSRYLHKHLSGSRLQWFLTTENDHNFAYYGSSAHPLASPPRAKLHDQHRATSAVLVGLPHPRHGRLKHFQQRSLLSSSRPQAWHRLAWSAAAISFFWAATSWRSSGESGEAR